MLPDPEQHKLCPKTFLSGDCECDCGHPGAKPIERLKAVSLAKPSRKDSKTTRNREES